MKKTRLLFVYHSMIIGGSTTSLLALLNNLDPEKYDIHLQLYRNVGPLLNMIPAHVKLLPAAEKHPGKLGRIVKILKFVFKGYAFKHIKKRLQRGKPFSGNSAIADFVVCENSIINTEKYDFAIGFMEGWSDKYTAFMTDATIKYAWIHSTFSKIAPGATKPLDWMAHMRKIVFVSDACRDAFMSQIPDAADKAVTIENITDSDIIRARGSMYDKDSRLELLESFDGLKIVTVCRITIPVKGLDRIVTAAKKLKTNGIPYIWYIIGDGEDTEKLRELIAKAEISDALIPIGKRINPYPYIQAADIMCMPSRYEGKPMVITESMILGTPPVVTEYLSAHEQISNGIDGIIVKNDDDSISNELCVLAADREKIRILSENLLSKDYGNKEYIKNIETELFN